MVVVVWLPAIGLVNKFEMVRLGRGRLCLVLVMVLGLLLLGRWLREMLGLIKRKWFELGVVVMAEFVMRDDL